MTAMNLGGGLELIPLDLSFDDELYALVDANRDHLARWLPWARTQTPAFNREFLEGCVAGWADGSAWSFGLMQDGDLAGTFGHRALDRANRSTLIGYWVAEGYQGRGLVTRAVTAYTDRLFEELDLNRIVIRAHAENRRSRAVAERAGYTFEGVLREVATFYDGFIDLAMYSMLRREWLARR